LEIAENASMWHDENPPEPDPLDALLAQADWPSPAPDSVARLRARWRNIRARRRFVSLLAAAAALLIGGSLWFVLTGQPVEIAEDANRAARERADDDERIADVERAATLPAESPAEAPREAIAQAPPAPSRPANRYERLVLAAAVRERQGPPASDVLQAQSARLEQTLERLTGDPTADVALNAATLIMERERYEQLLLARLQTGESEHRAAAMELLPHLASWRSVPLLRDQVRAGQTSAVAKLALARLGTPAEAAWLVQNEADRRLRVELLAALAERGDRPAVERFLQFVREPRRSHDALAALDLLEVPPLDALFAALMGNDVAVRQAAARALGRLNGPEVTARLIGQTQQGICRQEALLALIACRGDEAQDFVRQARHDEFLVAAVQAAEFQFRQFSDPRTRSIP
jgi:hypothetical protein